MTRYALRKIIVGGIALTVVLSGAALPAAAGAASAAGVKGLLAGRAPLRTGETMQQKEPSTLPIVEEAAGILGMKPADLAEQLKAGKSIAEIAQSKGVKEQDLVAKLLALRSGKLDAAVKAGKLTRDEAEAVKKKMDRHLRFMVRHKGLPQPHGKKMHFLHKEQMSKILGMSEQELANQLRSGKSLAEIAQARGISREQLISKIKEQMTPMIERMIDKKSAADGKAGAGS